MGTAKRNVSKIEKGGGGGWGRGWERAREPVPSSHSPSFFPALLLRATAPPSERLEQAVSQKENRRSLHAHAG